MHCSRITVCLLAALLAASCGANQRRRGGGGGGSGPAEGEGEGPGDGGGVRTGGGGGGGGDTGGEGEGEGEDGGEGEGEGPGEGEGEGEVPCDGPDDCPMDALCSDGLCVPRPDRICVPGATEFCLCDNGADGAMACDADGARWGPCQCEQPPDCSPFEVRDCRCPDGSAGEHTCDWTGAAWGDCECEPAEGEGEGPPPDDCDGFCAASARLCPDSPLIAQCAELCPALFGMNPDAMQCILDAAEAGDCTENAVMTCLGFAGAPA